MTEKATTSSDPSRSFNGENAYYFDCDIIGHRPSYFVCLHKLKRREQGPLPDPHQSCCAAIGSRQCPAAHMREKELLEGRSIYFEQRKRFEDMTPDRPRAPIVAGKPRTLPYIPKHEMPEAPAPVKRVAAEPVSVGLDFATIVNELAAAPREVPVEPAQQPAKPLKLAEVPHPSPKPENPPKATESLLEMARRLKESHKSLTTGE